MAIGSEEYDRTGYIVTLQPTHKHAGRGLEEEEKTRLVVG